jgi:hypothetical protein
MNENGNYSLDKLPAENQRGAHTIYCEQIREEKSGQSTMIGVFGSRAFFSEYPIIIPSFTILTEMWTYKTNPFTKVVYRVLFDDELWAEDPLDLDAMRENRAKNKPEIDYGYGVRSKLSRRTVYSPFVVQRPGVLRVRVETESGELRTNAVAFMKKD